MKKSLFLLLGLLLSLGISAQMEQLPLDPNVRYGHLDNGLTYYICHNEQPKQRCDFHIAQAVGAVLEEDNQNGLAHFLEHMAFNGTEHFPGKGIIEYFESVGVNFGGNINAYTSIDETVYRLSDVPTYREGIVDSALLVMRDWSCGLLLLGEEIDAERGVIREEWRTGRTASRRLWREIRAQQYPNSQYGKRDVIGDTAVINNFAYDALRAYYKKWYGPDNQAIIIVGDIDVDRMEQKLRALFAPVPERANRGERPLYTVDFNEQPRVCIATDEEAQQTRMEVTFLKPQIPAEYANTMAAYMQRVINGLVVSMFDERMEELSLSPEAPFLGAGCYYGSPVKLKDAFVAVTMPKEGHETEALRSLLEQVEKMRRYGFTADELERAKTNYLNRMEKSYNERQNRRNIAIAQECVRHFEDKEPMPGIEFEYQVAKQMLPMLDLGSVNQLAERFPDPNPTVAITGPKKEGVQIPSPQQVLSMLHEVSEMTIAAPEEKKVDSRLVKRAPKAGKIKSRTANTSLGTTEWLLSNGVRIIFRPTTFKQDEIRLEAFSYGGSSLVSTEDLPSCELATSAVEMMGLGTYSMTDLQKALTGKTVSLGTSINANTESLEGASSVKDLESLLQLVYLSFTAPRRDEEAFATLLSMMRSQLANKDNNPKAIFRDSVSMMQTGYSPRTVLMNVATLSQVSLDKCLAIYKERFANPADFTFIFVGNINPEDKETARLLLTYLGGLKTSKQRESFCDHHIRVPEGVAKNYFSRAMTTHTASNRIQYTSYDIPYSLANELNMEMVGRILSTRYLESIREREGGSYGVGTYGYVSAWPVSRAGLLMQFDTDPDKQARLMEIIHEEVQTIIANGPLATDLQKEKESMIKDFHEDVEKNEWWLETIGQHEKLGVNLYTDYIEAVNAITADTVRDMLTRLVAAGNLFEVVMLPE